MCVVTLSYCTGWASYILKSLWFLSTFFADIVSNIRVLQNMFPIITGTNTMGLCGYHKSSSFWSVIIIIIIIIIISFMQGIYAYIPEKNYVPREYSIAAILLLLFVVLISLVSVLNLLYFYISTFRSMCAVHNMAVFCSSLTSWFPGMLLTYFLNVCEIVPVAPIITGITFIYYYYYHHHHHLYHYHYYHHRYFFSPRRPCRIPNSVAHIPECKLPALYRILARHGVYINRTQHPNSQSPLLVFCNQIEALGHPYIWSPLASFRTWPHCHEHMLHCKPGCAPGRLFSSAKLSLLCITWGVKQKLQIGTSERLYRYINCRTVGMCFWLHQIWRRG